MASASLLPPTVAAAATVVAPSSPLSSVSPSPSSPSPLPTPQPQQDRSLADEAITLFFTNRFLSVAALSSSYARSSPRLALLNALMHFIRASSTHSDTDLNEAIAVIWSMEKIGAAIAHSPHTNAPPLQPSPAEIALAIAEAQNGTVASSSSSSSSSSSQDADDEDETDESAAASTPIASTSVASSSSSPQSSSASVSEIYSLEGMLLQADTHLLGAILQLIQQSYVKATWNIRKSYNFYDRVAKRVNALTPDADNAELFAWCEFGVGMFHLLISMLPSSVVKIAEWIGFTGDRVMGLKQLHSSVKRDKFMSAFSCLLLLNYYVVISVFTGEQSPLHLEAAEELLEWGRARYPGGLVFALMESRLKRCQKQLQLAIQLADQAVLDSYELPGLCTFFYFQKAWCAFFCLDFSNTAVYLDELLSPVRVSKTQHARAALAARSSKLKGVYEDEQYVYVPPPPASAQAFYSFHAGLCYAMTLQQDKAKQAFSKVKSFLNTKRPKPIDVYATRRASEMLARTRFLYEDYLLDVCEMILAWNGFSQMNDEQLMQLRGWLETAIEKERSHRSSSTSSSSSASSASSSASFAWDEVDRLRCQLYLASLLRALSLHEEASTLLHSTLLPALPKLESNKIAIACGFAAFTYHELAALALSQSHDLTAAQQYVTKAQSYKNYDLFNMLQIRLHSVANSIKQQQHVNAKK